MSTLFSFSLKGKLTATLLASFIDSYTSPFTTIATVPYGITSLTNIRLHGDAPGSQSQRVAFCLHGPINGNPTSIKFYHIFSDRPGYSSGTGGTLKAQLHSFNDTGSTTNPLPGVALGTPHTFPMSLSSLNEHFPTISWPGGVEINNSSNNGICTVFENLDQEPSQNYTSVNTLYSGPSPAPTPGVESQHTNRWITFVSYPGSSIWNRMDDRLPIVELKTTSGEVYGQSLMEVWSTSGLNRGPVELGTSEALKVMQAFYSNDPIPARIKVSLFAKATQSESITVKILENCSSPGLTGTAIVSQPTLGPEYKWHTFQLQGRPIQSGLTCIEFSPANPNSGFFIYPLRTGINLPHNQSFIDTTAFQYGYASRLTSDSGWQGWRQDNLSNRTDQHLMISIHK